MSSKNTAAAEAAKPMPKTEAPATAAPEAPSPAPEKRTPENKPS